VSVTHEKYAKFAKNIQKVSVTYAIYSVCIIFYHAISSVGD